MSDSNLSYCALSVCVAVILLAACGGLQSPIGAPGAMRQSGKVLTPGEKRASCPTATCIYVANFGDGTTADGSITVYPADATGDVPPYRTISGLTSPNGVAVDRVGRTYVALPLTNDVSVYAASANGNAPSLFTIAGPKTRIRYPVELALDAARRLHVLSDAYLLGRVTAYQAGAKGDARPIDTIQGKKTKLDDTFAGGIAADTLGNTYITTRGHGCTFGCGGYVGVVMFAAGAHGDAAPTRKIHGSRTQLNSPQRVAVDSSGNIYVLVSSPATFSVNVYAAGAHGNVSPIRVISGPATGLNSPDGIFVDPSGNIYVTNAAYQPSQYQSITVYAAGSNGNVSPIRTIAGSSTGLFAPDGIVVH